MRLTKWLKAGAVVGLMGGMLSLSAAPDASAQDRVRWKMAMSYPSKLTQLGTGGVDLSERIEAMSGGEFRLRPFEPNALVPPLEMFDAIGQGSIDAGWSTPGYWFGKESSLPLFAAVPFGPSAGEYLAWMYHGGGRELMDEVYAKHGIKSLVCGIIAPEASGWFREPIESVEDLKGLKMRFFGLGAKVMEKLGVSTQLLAGGDIYPALEVGSIDATEFSMPAIDLDLGFYQVAKHYYFPGWHQQSTLFELMINREKYEALPDRHKALLDTACRANITHMLAEGEAIQFAAMQELQDKGVTLHRWPPEILDTLEGAWTEVAAELAADDPMFKKAWDSLTSFREDYAIWKKMGYLE